MNDFRLSTTEDGNGHTYICLALKGHQCAMTLDGALLLFEKLGDTLVELGVIDEDEEEDSEVPRCH
jgi:hypothetical protein